MQLRSAVEEALDAPGPWQWRALGEGEGVGGARWRLSGADLGCFVKTGDADVLAAEADGLAALAQHFAATLPAPPQSPGRAPARPSAAMPRTPVPRVLAAGAGWLALEWLEFGRAGAASAARLGEALARLHLMPQPRFGWPRANFIGATPQFNTQSDDWIGFFREQRLGFQLRLAAENGHRGDLQEQGAELVQRLPRLFAGYSPRPALLHGDLWGGNWGALLDGGPVLFDPAIYCGDREADLAMTELFGGFPPEFYAAYRLHTPLDAGYALRRDLYNLYHVLNHLNLFGEGYLAQAERLIQRLLAEVR